MRGHADVVRASTFLPHPQVDKARLTRSAPTSVTENMQPAMLIGHGYLDQEPHKLPALSSCRKGPRSACDTWSLWPRSADGPAAADDETGVDRVTACRIEAVPRQRAVGM